MMISYGREPRQAHARGNHWLDIALSVGVSVAVVAYWCFLHRNQIRNVPLYMGELNAISHASWLTMWTWTTDYGGYYRYSPTALVAVGMIDRRLLRAEAAKRVEITRVWKLAER